MNIVNRATNFLKEVRLEMKKVSWPSREDVLRYTGMVILVSILVAIFLGGFDFLFQSLINKFVI